MLNFKQFTIKKWTLINNNSNFFKTALTTAIIFLLFVLSSYLFKTYQTDIEKIIHEKNILGMLIYILIFALSIILAPISAFPLIPIGSNLWGVTISTALSTIGWTAGAMIAFFIARKFGKPIVKKFISLKKNRKNRKNYSSKKHLFKHFFLSNCNSN